ncbi:hypothetical protein EVAR_88316_1 [Eumeta japonica]|uniref:Uncharacterized protein n=1 Tax=Eumeta variegata TaxID=151549 RepID=A0A4C1VPL2_EUMVA|nr:hypothetical protein EVAR_88316_1 [Eumeta japonica]
MTERGKSRHTEGSVTIRGECRFVWFKSDESVEPAEQEKLYELCEDHSGIIEIMLNTDFPRGYDCACMQVRFTTKARAVVISRAIKRSYRKIMKRSLLFMACLQVRKIGYANTTQAMDLDLDYLYEHKDNLYEHKDNPTPTVVKKNEH